MKDNVKNTIGIIIFVIVSVSIIIATFKKVFDIVTAMLAFAIVGVIFYFVFVAINYKHSIYGGRFEEHFGEKEDEDNSSFDKK